MPIAPHLVQGPTNPQGIGLRFSHRHSNLDVESTTPQGGPQNFPDYNHEHQYTPYNTYLNYSTPGGAGTGIHSDRSSQISDFGIDNDQIQPQNIFKDGTGLDIENPGPNNIGGPNRANAGTANIPTGQYQTTTATGPLTDEDGVFVDNIVHQYLPTNRYQDSLSTDDLPDSSTF